MNRRRLIEAFAAGCVATGTLAIARVAHALPEPESGHGFEMPRDVSADGWRIERLIDVTNYFVLGLLAFMLLWMITALILHNKSHEADYDDGNNKRYWVFPVSLAMFLFFVVDGNLFINSTLDMHNVFDNYAKAEAEPGAVRIQINAHQWAWDARYAGPDGKFNTRDDIVTLNDIRVPVGKPIIFQLASVDVIHSFYLPNLRMKKDVIPGMVTSMWVRAVQTGEFDIGCAQHCGVHHYKMKGLLTVLTQAQYDVWAAEMSADSARRFDPDSAASSWGWEWKSRAR